jgi:hypothetical protein
MAPVPPVMTATLPAKESVGSKLEVMGCGVGVKHQCFLDELFIA